MNLQDQFQLLMLFLHYVVQTALSQRGQNFDWPQRVHYLAKAAEAPPELPPAVSLVFHGLQVSPKIALYVLDPSPNSGVFDLPSGHYKRQSICHKI